MHDEIINYVLDCFDDLIIKHNLAVNIEIPLKTLFSIDLENKNDFMHICYSTHPSDYPFSFDVRYCKQKFFDRTCALYRTDTREITSLWRFDKNLNTTITGSLKKDMPIISECCKRTSEMFDCFQNMSDAEYYNASEKFRHA